MLQREFVHTGDVVLEQGKDGNGAYMIESGRIEIFIKDKDGDEVFLAELGPGMFFGEMAAIFGGNRCATARAREDSVLVAISGNDLKESARMSASMESYLTGMISERLKDTKEKILKNATEKMNRSIS